MNWSGNSKKSKCYFVANKCISDKRACLYVCLSEHTKLSGHYRLHIVNQSCIETVDLHFGLIGEIRADQREEDWWTRTKKRFLYNVKSNGDSQPNYNSWRPVRKFSCALKYARDSESILIVGDERPGITFVSLSSEIPFVTKSIDLSSNIETRNSLTFVSALAADDNALMIGLSNGSILVLYLQSGIMVCKINPFISDFGIDTPEIEELYSYQLPPVAVLAVSIKSQLCAAGFTNRILFPRNTPPINELEIRGLPVPKQPILLFQLSDGSVKRKLFGCVGLPVSLQLKEHRGDIQTVLITSLGLFLWQNDDLLCNFFFGSLVGRLGGFFEGLDLCVGGCQVGSNRSVICVFDSNGLMQGVIGKEADVAPQMDENRKQMEDRASMGTFEFQPDKFFSLKDEISNRKNFHSDDNLSIAQFDERLDALLLVNSRMDVRVCLGLSSSLSSSSQELDNQKPPASILPKLFLSSLTCSVTAILPRENCDI